MNNLINVSIAPSKFIIENFQKAAVAETLTKKFIYVAFAGLGVLFILAFSGFVAFVVGRIIHKKASSLAPVKYQAFVKRMGESIEYIGRKLFLGSCMSVYIPLRVGKETIQKIPDFFSFVAHKIVYLACQIFEHVCKPLWQKILYPVLECIRKTVFQGLEIINRAIVHLLTKVGNAVDWIVNEILAPLWFELLCPALEYVGERITEGIKTLDKGIRALATLVVNVTRWVYEEALLPLWEKILCPIFEYMRKKIIEGVEALDKGIRALATLVVNVARWVYEEALVPLWEKILSPTFEYIRKKIIEGVEALDKGIRALATLVVNVARWVYEEALVPLWEKILSPTFEYMRKKIIEGVEALDKGIRALATLVVNVARWVYEEALMPLWEKILYPTFKCIAKQSIKGMRELVYRLRKVAHWIFNEIIYPFYAVVSIFVSEKIFHPCLSLCKEALQRITDLYERFIPPLLEAMGELLTKMRVSMEEMAKDLAQALNKAWESLPSFT